jgi:hypothetical protein
MMLVLLAPPTIMSLPLAHLWLLLVMVTLG